MGEPQLLRAAGYNERRCIVRDVLGLYGSVITAGVYSGPTALPNDSVPTDIIVQALKACVAKHPVLSCIVHDAETEKPLVAKATTIDFTQHVRVVDAARTERHNTANSIKALLQHVHDSPLPDFRETPPWAVYVSKLHPSASSSKSEFVIAFAWSHAFVDGIGGFVFHKTFLEALRNDDSTQYDTAPLWIVRTNGEIIPPLELASTFPISWSFLLGPLLKEYFPSFARMLGYETEPAGRMWTGASARPVRRESDRQLPTKVELILISQATLKRVLDACKAGGARLTGLLNCLFAYAVTDALRARGQDYDTFAVETAIDLRRCLPVAKDQMANYVSGVYEVITTENHAKRRMTHHEWEAVARSTNLLAKKSSTLSNQPIALLKYLSNYREWTLKNASHPPKESIAMSNLGSFDAGIKASDDGWNIGDVVFSQAANGTGPPLAMNVAGATSGSLAVTVTWWPGMLGVDDEDKFVQDICGNLSDRLDRVS